MNAAEHGDSAFDDAGRDDIGHLLAIMARLRDPQQGCPWDLQQSFATIAPYTIEDTRDIRNMDAYSRLAHMVDPA